MLTITLAIMIPFLAAVFIPIIHKIDPRTHIGWFVLGVPAVLFVALFRLVPFVAKGGTKSHTLEWLPSYGINFTTHLDGLSMIFGLLITGIGTLVTLYSIYYLSEKESLRHFYIYLLFFMGAMLGVVFSDNIMVIYVFWELTSISSFLLIAFWYHRKQSRYGAQKSLLITVMGGFAIFISFIMIYHMTGTFSVREITSSVGLMSESRLFIPAMLLLLLGAFTKSAQFPFHIWLPDAMEAPTPVSAYLHSATMVKAGIYLVARFTPVFGGEEIWFWAVSGIGIITLFWGSFFAVRQTDLKALLAYSTVSQLGMIMSMLGFGSIALYDGYSAESILYSQAVFAALFHLINHATFKGTLFMIIGIIDLRVGTRDIRRLGGLMSIMPVSFTIAAIGSFSMAGLPPFNGFLSKEMFFTSLLDIADLDIFSLDRWGTLIPVIAWIASVFTFVYCMIIVFKAFFGKYKGETYDRKLFDAPLGMLISPVILALFVVFIFAFPNVVGQQLVMPALESVFPSFTFDGGAFSIQAWHGWNTELWMTIGIVIVGSLLYKTYRHWEKIYRIFPAHLSFDAVYNHTIAGMEKGSSTFTKRYMTGYLRDYLMYIYLFFIVAIGGVLFISGSFSWDMSGDSPLSSYEWIFIVIMVSAAVAILFAKSRITAILLNSVLGFSIVFLFVLFRAPDLALTQTIIETVTTVLFMLCFYFLPEWKKEQAPKHTKLWNMVISICVGLVFIAVGLSVNSGSLSASISSFFEDAYELTGGKNIVNAILGDFRAFDTMLEVTVLFIAGIGVFSVIKLGNGKGRKSFEKHK